MTTDVDALVIGGGFYGCRIGLALREIGFQKVSVVERESAIMRRASFVNQARVHGGYHYPRSLPTGVSSRRNYRRFVEEHSYAVVPDVRMVYGIARTSRVTASQFARFCCEIGAECREDRRARDALFDVSLIEECFSVDEIAFDSSRIASDLECRLAQARIDLRLGVVVRIVGADARGVDVETSAGPIRAAYVFNCTYAYLDTVGAPTRSSIKKELAEIALVSPPRALAGRAVTVMDGPFFSSMPFPALHCYSLTHVRYTPHRSWTDQGDGAGGGVTSRAAHMLRDSMRYMPSLAQAKYLGSLYELKAILVRSEESDARPIVFERAGDAGRIVSILGSKIDNVYDVVALLAQERWS